MRSALERVESFDDPFGVPPDRVFTPEAGSATRWLAMGGDARIDPDPATGLNRYYAGLTPGDVPGFGSCTASSLSADALAAAEVLQRRLAAQASAVPAPRLYGLELARIRRELIGLCQLDDVAGLELAFAASGTDIHLLAAQIAAATGDGALVAATVEAAETGGGVPQALAGRHFALRTALGATVTAGARLGGSGVGDTVAIAARGPDGRVRPAGDVLADLDAVVAALAPGRRLLLCVTDLSKTGLLAPDLAGMFEMAARNGGRVQLLIDACQFRLSPQSLRTYLDRGCLVAVTGSKFLTGPAFSGALLIPAGVAAQLRGRPLPAAMGDYASRADLPDGWGAGLADGANFGLLLRWEAALAELRAFRQVPDWTVAQVLQGFERHVAGRLADDSELQALPAPRPDRRALGPGGWDSVQTVFPFLLRRDGRNLDRDQTQAAYRALAADPVDPVRLGQPVACGERAGVAVSALRLCCSARLVVEAARDGLDGVLTRADRALDRVVAAARAV